MSQFDYKESFGLIDLKLGLGLATVIIAGGLFGIEKVYKLKLFEMYSITVIGVVLYGLINIILTLVNYKYKNVKYIGYKKNKDKVTITTWSTKYDPIYNISITFNDITTVTNEYQFKEFYDQLGYFNSNAFMKLIEQDLQKKSQ